MNWKAATAVKSVENTTEIQTIESNVAHLQWFWSNWLFALAAFSLADFSGLSRRQQHQLDNNCNIEQWLSECTLFWFIAMFFI